MMLPPQLISLIVGMTEITLSCWRSGRDMLNITSQIQIFRTHIGGIIVSGVPNQPRPQL